ncbi:phage terminase small subunit-related protein [Ornithobacterium rhinotracheale]|uniref:phage terminase small subunit-related protein n=1 Tax=Ornithobacterium rhinotracheale TaxID=28251 RepID=UPI001FF117AC|nr:phage terminase small subunit-related protein [Ornithobacterium rhinotracheale]MCK0203286.1 phage terminase small subunit-related protein [Ornithobacterium rhinotracheale]
MAKTHTRLKAEEFYIENLEITLKEVAEHFKVTEKTIGNWAKADNWEQKRLNFHASPTAIKQKLQQEALRVANGEPATFNADAVNKLMAAIDRLNKQADPIVIHKILKELDFFIAEQDPQFAKECTKYHKLFLQLKINNIDKQ